MRLCCRLWSPSSLLCRCYGCSCSSSSFSSRLLYGSSSASDAVVVISCCLCFTRCALSLRPLFFGGVDRIKGWRSHRRPLHPRSTFLWNWFWVFSRACSGRFFVLKIVVCCGQCGALSLFQSPGPSKYGDDSSTKQHPITEMDECVS